MLKVNEAKPAVYREVVTRELVEPAVEETFTLTLNRKQMLFLLILQGSLPSRDDITPLTFEEWRIVKKQYKSYFEKHYTNLLAKEYDLTLDLMDNVSQETFE